MVIWKVAGLTYLYSLFSVTSTPYPLGLTQHTTIAGDLIIDNIFLPWGEKNGETGGAIVTIVMVMAIIVIIIVFYLYQFTVFQIV